MLQPLPETPLCSAVDNLRGTVDGMLSALSPQQTAPPAPHRGGQATSPASPDPGGASAGASAGASGGASGASGASGGASSGGVSGSSSARGAPVAQRVAHWQAFVRTSQALLGRLQQDTRGDAAARAARVDESLLEALPRCLTQAMEGVAEASAARSEREAHYAQHEQLYLDCAVRELSGRPAASAECETAGGSTPGGAPRQAAREALERSYRAMLAGLLLPARATGPEGAAHA